MKSEVQRKAAEKPLGTSPKASNKKALNNLMVGEKAKGQEPRCPVGKAEAGFKRGPTESMPAMTPRRLLPELSFDGKG